MTDNAQSKLLDALAESSAGPNPSDLRILERCREMAVGSLSGALKGMLDRLVDDFLALADKSTQNEMQNLYLDAMTVARDKRSIVEHGFRLHFIRNFNAEMRSGQAKKPSLNIDTEDEFSLVNPDELEESIAIQEMAAKSPRRMISAREMPMRRALERRSSGSLFVRIEMKMRLSMPSTTSIAISVARAAQAAGSAARDNR